MRTLATKASMLIDRYLDRAIAEVEADPAAALKLPVKELRALLASTADKLLPPPPREEEAPQGSAYDGMSLEELEARLAELKRLRSEYAKIIDGDEVEPD